ncbi:MAG: hypothetical protein ACP5MB_11230, partial [bacterium]
MPTFASVGGNSVLAYVAITITNSQSSATPSPFQQQIKINSSNYSSYLASNLQNVNFQDGNGSILNSWLESGNSNTSTSTIYWVSLPNGIGANSSITIYYCIYATSVNCFNTTNTGEAPQLTSTYAQYDDGANVFNNYWNFAGTNLPSGWQQQANGNTITINNGITMTTAGSDNVSYVWYNTAINPQNTVLEAYFTNATSNGSGHDETIDYASSTSFPTTTGWPPTPFIAVGMHNTFEIYNGSTQSSGNNQFTPVLVSLEYTSGNTAIPLFNYTSQNVPTESASSLMSSAYPTIELNWGGYNTLSIQYMRIRAYPPSGTMPSTSLGSVTQNTIKITYSSEGETYSIKPFINQKIGYSEAETYSTKPLINQNIGYSEAETYNIKPFISQKIVYSGSRFAEVGGSPVLYCIPITITNS